MISFPYLTAPTHNLSLLKIVISLVEVIWNQWKKYSLLISFIRQLILSFYNSIWWRERSYRELSTMSIQATKARGINWSWSSHVSCLKTCSHGKTRWTRKILRVSSWNYRFWKPQCKDVTTCILNLILFIFLIDL